MRHAQSNKIRYAFLHPILYLCNMKKHIPNMLTLLNLCSGCLAILYLLVWQPEKAALCVIVSLVADFLDGFVARLLHVSGPLGKELDSLADVVSFGVVPAMMLYLIASSAWRPAFAWQSHITLQALPVFLVTAFSALRLAKFNLDERQTENFIGLNTPSCTLFVMGLLLTYTNNSFGLGHFISHQVFIYSLVALLCYLLICEVPMFGFKSLSLRWEGNQIRLTFVALSVGLIIGFKAFGLTLSIALYIVINLFLHVTRKSTT